jgi:hypothetical protein
LTAPRSNKQPVRCVITRAEIDSEGRRNAPRILNVKPETLHVLRERAVPTPAPAAAPCIIGRKLSGIGYVIARIMWKRDQRFGITREFTAKHGLVDEVHAELDRMGDAPVHYVIPNLIFLLVAQDGKSSNGRRELVVAKGFKS